MQGLKASVWNNKMMTLKACLLGLKNCNDGMMKNNMEWNKKKRHRCRFGNLLHHELVKYERKYVSTDPVPKTQLNKVVNMLTITFLTDIVLYTLFILA